MMTMSIAVFAMTAMPLAAGSSPLIPSVDATREMALCVLKKDRANAVAIAASEPATAAFDKAARRIEPALSNCLKPEMQSLTIRINDLRGVFAELLLKEGDNAALVRARTLPAVAPRRITLGKYTDVNDSALFRCVAEADPLQAATLVQAMPGSADEGAAFRGLSVALQGCVPANAAMHVKPYQVRLLIAASLYGRLAALPGA